MNEYHSVRAKPGAAAFVPPIGEVSPPTPAGGVQRQRSGGHTATSAFKRLLRLLRGVGLTTTLAILASAVEDRWLNSFDSRYGTKTSGSVELASTSFASDKLSHTTGYAPVNPWAFARLLAMLSLSKALRFADLGCGLGRACIVAAEYGFSQVTGVDLAPELCAVARDNVSAYYQDVPGAPPVYILLADALDYCTLSEDDVFFMFRPFSFEFTRRILDRLADRSVRENRLFTVIYTERVMMDWNYAEAFLLDRRFRLLHEGVILGQSFHVFQCGPQLEEVVNLEYL